VAGRTRRRASAARLLRVCLTARAAAILRDVVRFGALTVEQIGRHHFRSVWTAYDRLKAVVDAGYLELVRVWHGAPGVYVATPEGTRVAGAGLLPAPVDDPKDLVEPVAVRPAAGAQTVRRLEAADLERDVGGIG
jgi:hypothetical protein